MAVAEDSGAGGITGADAADAIDGPSETGGLDGTSGTDGGADTSGDAGDAGRGCAQTLFGHYLLRLDGALVYEADPPTIAGPFTAETPVLDDDTGALLTGVSSVEDGDGYGCAVLSHSVSCWRKLPTGNSRGALANGTEDTIGPLFRATKALLAPNAGFDNAVNVADVESFEDETSCAVTADGRIYCWGLVTDLLFGGLPSSTATPTVITADGTNPFPDALQVTINGTYACALAQSAPADASASGKEVWCWGTNGNGYLGVGDTFFHPYPTKAVGLTNPSRVMAFGSFGTTCAIDNSNVRCWGSDTAGQVGNGNSTVYPVLTPTLVTLADGTTPLAGIVDIKGGGQLNVERDFVCALSADHDMYCWGVGYQANPSLVASNVMALGAMDTGVPRYLTSDGVYHIGQVTRTPSCGPLP